MRTMLVPEQFAIYKLEIAKVLIIINNLDIAKIVTIINITIYKLEITKVVITIKVTINGVLLFQIGDLSDIDTIIIGWWLSYIRGNRRGVCNCIVWN